jgi:glycosyltransferase involved in cell wall biosynthesis
MSHVAAQTNIPLVSVIVPVYNDPERIKLCIEALLQQTYPHDCYEILIVDNGSADTTRAVIARYEVTLLIEQTKQSSYAARNKGLTHARGEIIAFTDSDCIPASDWIASGVAQLMAAPHVGLVGGKIDVFFKDPSHPTAAELYDRVTAFPQHDFVEKQHFGATANLFSFRHMFDRVGLFNDTLKSGGDREWGNRVFAAGYPIIYADDTCVAHPARDSLDELYNKAIRVTEGLYRLKHKNSRALPGLIKGIVWELIPPWKIIARICADKRIEGYNQKLKAIAVLVSIKLLRVRARIELYRTHANSGHSVS